MTGRFIRLNWAASEAPPEQSRLLEGLLADAERKRETDWRGAAFSVLAPAVPLPPIAAVRLRAGGLHGEGFACLASAVHYVAELSNVRLHAQGLLRLSEAEAGALAQDFNRVFNDGSVCMVATRAVLCCVFTVPLEAQTSDPAAALGRHVDAFLPQGKDAQRLRSLASEMEMWLFDHPVNRARGSQGAPLINGLWLWGGGDLGMALPAVTTGASGEDVLFDVFDVGDLGAAAVVVSEAKPGSEAWMHVETEWLAPVARGLKQGRVAALAISVRDSIWRINAGRRWKFWRRTKPWWQSFDDAADD